jgi:uncharacterized protein (DUF302 family)
MSGYRNGSHVLFGPGLLRRVSEYGYSVEIPEGYDEAVMRTRLAMRAEGFSVVTEMHVGGLLGPEQGSERQYLIMGAWNAATTQEIEDGVRAAIHLPCNVVVQELAEGAMVAALDPRETVTPESDVPDTAVDLARDALARMLQKVATQN